MEALLQSQFRLGDWWISPGDGEIRNAHGSVHIEPRAMAALCVLAAHPGETVSRQTLQNEVWGELVVNDEALTRIVHELRTHLGDDSKQPRYIQTVSKRGYRLIAPVTGRSAMRDVPSDPVRATRRQLRWLATAGLSTLAASGLVAAYLLLRSPPQPAAKPPSIAVLPFRNFSEDADFAYFGDGIAEELLHQLARRPGLRVVARTSSFAFRNRQVEIPEIARDLGVDAVVEGSVRKSGTHLRVTAQLVDAHGYHLWSEQFETSLGELLSVQERTADHITRALAPHLAFQPASNRVAMPGTVNAKAAEDYLKARELMARPNRENLYRAIELLHKAVDADPRFVRALGSEALAWWMLTYYADEPLADASRMAARAANRALAEDSSVVEAHLALAWVQVLEHRWLSAEDELRFASRLEPGSATAENWYAGMLFKVGRREESLRREEHALQLNPYSEEVLRDLAFMRFSAGDNAGLREVNARLQALDLTPNPRFDKLIAIREKNWEAARRLWVIASRRAGVEPEVMQAVVDALAGRVPADQALTTLRAAEADASIPLFWLFLGYAYLDADDDAGRAALKLEASGKWVLFDFWWPEFDRFRGHKTFAALAARTGLAEYWDRRGAPPECRRRTEGWLCPTARTFGTR